MNSKQQFHLILIFLFLPVFLYAQPTQTLRGQVLDQVLQKPISGATVFLPSQNKSVLTDDEGHFKLINVPIGLQQLKISHSSYKPTHLENLQLISGKETVLNISMELDIKEQDEVVVKAKAIRTKPMNELSVVSARAFSVEETQRYAAAVNDPLRMATSFAGVVSADDGGNNIVIRGNAPTGLLWKMEGVDIPNPNHFAVSGSSGGGISILSAQLLANSDFVTGAFAAEYGNALSGVFDLSLRKGNNEKREYTVQAGLLGLNLAAEGPFSKKYKGSYLINYRYSTLSLLEKMGLNLGTGTTNFQDLSYNIYLPAGKAGSFTLFGFGGKSTQEFDTEKDPTKWEEESDRYGGRFKGNTIASGITHRIALGKKMYLKSAISYSLHENGYNEEFVAKPDSIINSYKDNYSTKKQIISTTLNYQFNRKHFLRTGLLFNNIQFDYYQRSRENPNEPVLERINVHDQTQTIQAFAQWQYKLSNKLTVNTGLHYLELMLNNSRSLEPRASVKWDINKQQSIGFGYGRHSQLQAMGVYFAKSQEQQGDWTAPNKGLGFTKADHFVLSYNRQITQGWKLRTEIYYQSLFNVPVSRYDTSSFSTLNVQQDFVTDALQNKGRGENYGLEITVEKQLRNYFYFLFSNSFYQSRYSSANGTWYNTRFNGNFASTLTAGKEFVQFSNKRSFGANIKMVYAGGYRETPIDLAASQESGYTKYVESEAFTIQNPNYFRTDIRISMKWNRANHTSTLSLDVQNLTNRQNIYAQYFDAVKGKIVSTSQAGIIPVLNYKIEF